MNRARQPRHLRCKLRLTDLRFPPRDHRNQSYRRGQGSRRLAGFVHIQRNPYSCTVREVESLRHHAENRSWFAVEDDRGTNNIRIASQPGMPERVAQYRNGRCLHSLLLRYESTAQHRLRPHHAEE